MLAQADSSSSVDPPDAAPPPGVLMEVLRTVGERLLGVLDLKHLLPTLADCAADVTGALAAGVSVYAPGTGELEVVAGIGPAPRAGRHGAAIAGTLRQGGVRCLPAGAFFAGVPPEVPPCGSVLVAPMYHEGALLGALWALKQDSNDWDAELLALLATQGTLAIRNAAFYRESLAKAEALKQANAQLSTLDRAKDRFLGVVSHELRTPLNHILGFASVLHDTPAAFGLTGEAVHYLGRVLESGERLTELVNRMLDYVRLRTGELKLRLEPVSLSAALARLAPECAAACQARGVAFEPERAGALPYIRGDADRLEEVLFAVLDNALKASPPGSRIRLRTALAESGVRLVIEDEGPGITAERLATLADPEAAFDVETPGTGLGLGLVLVRGLMEAMEGELRIESPTQGGRGTRVTLAWRAA